MKREVALGITTMIASVLPLWYGAQFAQDARKFGVTIVNFTAVSLLLPGVTAAIAGVLLLAGKGPRYLFGVVAWALLAAVAAYDLELSWRSLRIGGDVTIEPFVVALYLIAAVPVVVLLIRRARRTRAAA